MNILCTLAEHETTSTPLTSSFPATYSLWWTKLGRWLSLAPVLICILDRECYVCWGREITQFLYNIFSLILYIYHISIQSMRLIIKPVDLITEQTFMAQLIGLQYNWKRIEHVENNWTNYDFHYD
jgi:hypothetical protein